MNKSRFRFWFYDVMFVLILLVAAYFRLSGLNWDQDQHLHPDERFMTMVESAVEPVKGLSEYFNTDTSTLNPHNRGYSFYVYGDLPVTIVRYAAEWMSGISTWAAQNVQAHGADGPFGALMAGLGKTTTWAGYDEVTLVGRVFSALSDLGSIILLYLIAARLYGRKVAVLAAAFSSLAVMQIQGSHFFTVDMFANFFIFLATYFAVEVMVGDDVSAEIAEVPASAGIETRLWSSISANLRNPLLWNVIGFGLALGAAVASKILAAPLAALLPGALLVRYFRQRSQASSQQPVETDALPDVEDAVSETVQQPLETEVLPDVENTVSEAVSQPLKPKHTVFGIETYIILLVMGALVSALAFRVFMPYAFSGPGFFGVTPNPKWVANMTEQRSQASGDVDYPPALQWARRSFWFSGYNLAAWGLGWPLGILAVLGFVYMGWRILTGEWKEHILLWGWTGAYFVWQSLQWNPTMRYQLPIYPLLALLAAWFIFNGPRFIRARSASLAPDDPGPRPSVVAQIVYSGLALLVLVATFAWAFAFTRIYTRDHSRVQATRWIFQNVPGPYNLKIQQADGTVYTQPMSMPTGLVLNQAAPYDVQFAAFASGKLTEIFIDHALNVGNPGTQTLSISVAGASGMFADQALANASLTSDFGVAPASAQSGVTADPRGQAYTFKLDKPVALEKDQIYFLRFTTDGSLSMVGSAPVEETSWDDGLPLRMDGYDAFGGMYQGDLNLEMYWDDNADKLNRFETNLDAGDYVFISSNRQWATTTRVPERYPLTTAYYRDLIGCPADKDVIWCYNTATPGMFTGKLGFELVKTFTSYPELFGHQFNTQFAEEAFTVYDAPKVLIFKKTAAYNSQTMRSLLGAVDLTHVVHVTPRQAGQFISGDLMLPADQLATDRANGTWSELYSYEALQNKYPLLGLVIWYLAIGLLGLFTWPLLRFLLPGLSDKGYPLARLSGLLLLAYMVWLTASLGGQYSRLTIAVGYGLIVAAGVVAYFVQREAINQELRSRGKYFLLIEGLFLVFFLIDLSIRLGNPDLWHPARGGERPMDFSYLNAVLKSTTFPPYDPWYAGGYINYYYWGFVLVGTPIKLLGIVPSIAYNFVLPTLFAMLGLGGFSVAWNLMGGIRPVKAEIGVNADALPAPVPSDATGTGDDADESVPVETSDPRRSWIQDVRDWVLSNYLPLTAGLAAGVGLVLLGNLGTIQLIYHALQKMVVSNEVVDAQNVWIFQRWIWAAQGLAKLFTGAGTLPIGVGEYYWAPSRVMPLGDLAITEFPLFTFIYSDLHAHMIALPLTVLAVAWMLSTLLVRKLSRWSWLATLIFGGLVIGVLRPTNTWDFPTYLIFGVVITGYATFRYADVGAAPRYGLAPIIQRVFLAVLGMGMLAGFALLLYQPYAQMYGLAYTEVTQWVNEKTPIWSYWTQWGVFLFVIISWMVWETRQWLAQTPLSSLARLKPYELWLELGAALFVGLLVTLQFVLNVPVAWFAFPLAAWALILMLRPGQPDVKRLVLFMVGTGLVLTMVVEVIVLSGDIGRMNTVFKFYLQVWVLLALSAAAALGWILAEFSEWDRRGRVIFQIFGGILLAAALLFTFTASLDKIRDRMAANIPFTFDSMTYMKYSTYSDFGADFDLSQDYRAIRWMQDNVKGSPVIVEGNTVEYHWGTRYTIYTGLPGVVGWSWHQRQQRALFPSEWVTDRIQEITDFYNTPDSAAAKAFLSKYSVKYIIVGQMERAEYNADGLAKFEQGEGSLWKTVYHDADTVIYEVAPVLARDDANAAPTLARGEVLP
jgi:YYY domain-containing protein